MRVLLLVEACGGVARHVTDLAAGLHAQGVEVHLLYSPQRADAVLAAGLQRLESLTIPARRVLMGPEPAPADLRAWREIRNYLRRHGPFNVVHGHSSKGGALARLAAGPGCKAKIYTPHAFVTMNPGLPPAKRFFYSRVERLLAAFGDAVIASSGAELAHARACLGIPEKKLFLVPNGIEPPAGGTMEARNELRRRWGIAEEEVVVGTIIRFVPQKAPELLIQAFARLLPRGEKVRLVMVGDGPLRTALAAEAARLGIDHAIVWPGFVESAGAMAAFDLFALGSRYEGFPYVLLDALAAGLPIVTTAVGGAEMAVAEGENGFMVPVGGGGEMTEALATLLCDAGQRRRMGEASRCRAERFTAAAMVAATLAVYRQLVAPVAPQGG